MEMILFFSGVLFSEIVLQEGWVRILLKARVVQHLKQYGPQNHLKEKQSTPTMGGIIFILVSVFAGFALVFSGLWDLSQAASILGFPVTAGLIGLADDLLKHFKGSSEGFRSLQKLAVQVAAAIFWSQVYMNEGMLVLTPGFSVSAIPGSLILVFLMVGALNAVNITDGLDGLASGATAISFIWFIMVVPSISPAFQGAVTGLALTAGFLVHNFHPARIFMGDCGSHFLGGLLVSICAAENLLLLVIPLGFIMGIEVLSVIVQIIAIRGFNRKVFRMSPIHHHFEMAGWNEKRVVLSFWAFHFAGMILLTFVLEGVLY